MKTLLLAIIAFALISPLQAANVGLKWNPNPVEDEVIRYEVSYHTEADPAPVVVNVPAPDVRVTLTGLKAKVRHFFTVVAVNGEGLKSEPSDVLEYVPPLPAPAKPTGVQVAVLEETFNMLDWTPVAYYPLIDPDHPTRFLRIRLTTIDPNPELANK